MTQVDYLIFGGAFDPPHLGHTRVVDQVLATDVCSQLWLMPVGQHPFLKSLAPARDRLAMVDLAFSDLAAKWGRRLKISTFELDHPEVAYSYQTLTHFKAREPKKTFGWLIGSDNVSHFKKWRHSQELLTKFRVLVYPRVNYPVVTSDLPAGMELLSEVALEEASSREIRRRLQLGQSISELVDPAVESYISEHLLDNYRS